MSDALNVPLTARIRHFLRQHTTLRSPPLCPELRLHLADSLETAWHPLQRSALPQGASPPYWALAWPAGQALTRFLFDHAELVRGRTVLDVGAGSGICAIAAAIAGARQVGASDCDLIARYVISENAYANNAAVDPLESVLTGAPVARRWDVIVAADVWYERFAAWKLTAWLRQRAREGACVLLCDTGRTFFPRQGLHSVAEYAVPPDEGGATMARIWRLMADDSSETGVARYASNA